MSSVDSTEITKFSRLAAEWWNPTGPMRPLHRMNPLRVAWIDQRIPAPARLLDLGCGAGIAAEALAARGHYVLGLDASAEAIQAAESHAAGQGLALRYRAGQAEHLLAALTRPGGRVFVSTLNRTWRSLAVAKIGAEYIARLLPRGTHDWRRFLPPDALASHARAAGLSLVDITGMEMSVLSGDWRATRDVGVNYIAAFVRAR